MGWWDGGGKPKQIETNYVGKVEDQWHLKALGSRRNSFTEGQHFDECQPSGTHVISGGPPKKQYYGTKLYWLKVIPP